MKNTSTDLSDNLKTLTKSAQNFLKMLLEESCELIKINYWTGLENQIKNLNLINNDRMVNLIFDEILKKNLDILTSSGLLFSMLNFLREKSETLSCYLGNLFDLMHSFSQYYEDSRMYFNEYLFDLAFSSFFDKKIELDKITSETFQKILKFYHIFIEYDIELFSVTLKNKLDYTSNDGGLLDLIFSNNYYLDLFTHYLTKLFLLGKFDTSNYYLEKIEYIIGKNTSQDDEKKNLIVIFLGSLIKSVTNLKLFQHFSDNSEFDLTRQHYVTALFSLLKLFVIIVDLQVSMPIIQFDVDGNGDGVDANSKHNKQEVFNFYKICEKFLIYILDLVIYIGKASFIFSKIFIKFLDRKTFPNFYKNFCIFLVLNAGDIFDINTLNSTLDFLNELLNQNNYHEIELIVSCIILKIYTLSQKLKYTGELGKNISDKLKFFIKIKDDDNNINNDKLIIDSTSVSDYLQLQPHFNLSNYQIIIFIIENIFSINNLNDKNEIYLSFNQTAFTNILKTLLNLNLEKYDLRFQNILYKFIFQLTFTFYDDIIKYKKISNQLINNQDSELFNYLFLNISKISHKIFLKNDIYPIVINFIQNILYPNYSLYANEHGLKIFDYFFSFLFQLSRHDNIANLTSKLIIALFNLKINYEGKIEFSNKYYSLNKFTELVISTNSSKFFNLYLISV